MTDPDWLSTSEVAVLLGRTRQWVARMLDDEDHEHFPGAWRMPGGKWQVPRSSVATFLEVRKRAVSRVHRRKPDGTHPPTDVEPVHES